jgi:HK97 family phage portal protein
VSLFRNTATARPLARREFTGIPGAGSIYTGIMSGRTATKQGAAVVTEDRALTHSGVWAATRLRADLVSTFPVGVYKDRKGLPEEMTTPPILVSPGGRGWDFTDWMWASQQDLDRSGNAIGLITARNGIQTPYYPDGLPLEIQLQDLRACSVVVWKGQVLYRINGKTYQPRDVYHERQYPWSGSPVGLSPHLFAAASIGEFLSLQQYGLDWFGGGGVPKAWMKNTVKRLQDNERTSAKQWYQDTIRNGEIMVTGNDWEYNMIQADQAGMEWLAGRQASMGDIARYFGVPTDLIDAAVSGQSITYANITQRNLQFLIMNLGPAVHRREKNLTNLLPQPRYVKLNTDALLRMDPQTRQEVLRSKLETWQLTNAEVREIEDLAPLTKKQMDEQADIYGVPKMVTVRAAVAGGGGITPNPASTPAPAEQPGQVGAAKEKPAIEQGNQPKQLPAAPAK